MTDIINKVKCDKCGYVWYSKSKMTFVSCPDCNGKVRREENIISNDGNEESRKERPREKSKAD